MQTTTSPQERIAFWKDAKRQLIQQHVDIDRLWRLAGDYTSEGMPFGGDGTITTTSSTSSTTSSTSSTTTSAFCVDCDSQYVTSGISGITNRSGSMCDTSLNGDWTLDRLTGQCAWASGAVPGGCCGASVNKFRLEYQTGGTFLLLYCSTGGYPHWQSASGQVCNGTAAITLTLVTANGFENVPTTITITPVP